jgi:hypothetical protein
MKVVFSNLKGDKKAVRLGFSFGYFILGPFYLLFKKRFGRFVILAALYTLGLWAGAGVQIASWLQGLGLDSKYTEFLHLPNDHYLYSVIVIALLHLIMTVYTPKIIARKILRKGYIPFSELDTQKLIKYRLVRVGCKSFLSAFTPVEGVPGKIVVHNEKEYEYHIEQITSLLRGGIITKDEYNARRAAIFMDKKKK